LPFEKIDVQNWVSEQSANPAYFMFNPVSQAIIGFGWLELVIRGLLLGMVFAKIRAWYSRRSQSFWVTLLYFYILIISYYTIRSTAIYFLTVCVLFRFIPVYLLGRIVTRTRDRVQQIEIAHRRSPVVVSSSSTAT